MRLSRRMMVVSGSAGGKRGTLRSSRVRAGKLPESLGRNPVIHLVFLVVVSNT